MGNGARIAMSFLREILGASQRYSPQQAYSRQMANPFGLLMGGQQGASLPSFSGSLGGNNNMLPPQMLALMMSGHSPEQMQQFFQFYMAQQFLMSALQMGLPPNMIGPMMNQILNTGRTTSQPSQQQGTQQPREVVTGASGKVDGNIRGNYGINAEDNAFKDKQALVSKDLRLSAKDTEISKDVFSYARAQISRFDGIVDGKKDNKLDVSELTKVLQQQNPNLTLEKAKDYANRYVTAMDSAYGNQASDKAVDEYELGRELFFEANAGAEVNSLVDFLKTPTAQTSTPGAKEEIEHFNTALSSYNKNVDQNKNPMRAADKNQDAVITVEEHGLAHQVILNAPYITNGKLKALDKNLLEKYQAFKDGKLQ